MLRGFQLSNTVIVLPLCYEKVKSVKKQLSSIDPKFLMFISKIKKLTIREMEHMDINMIYTIPGILCFMIKWP